jgi:DNA-binding MarR family transcriptional regulator
MHAIAFGTKRAFHGFLRVTRRPFESFGLTAARFDLLQVLFKSGRGGAGLTSYRVQQSALRRALGVSASVVSRMLKSLDALGLTERTRCRFDGRERVVTLTAAGLERIRRAGHVILRAVARLVPQAICFGKHRDPNARLLHTEELESYLQGLRHDFGDHATLYYPWGHPDD